VKLNEVDGGGGIMGWGVDGSFLQATIAMSSNQANEHLFLSKIASMVYSIDRHKK
jgi:hypothetical protein